MTELLTAFHFMRPAWLWLLLPAGVLAALLWRLRGRSASWRSVIAPQLLEHLLDGEDRRRNRLLLPTLLAGWVCAVVAIAGPSWQRLPQPVLQKQDALIILLDLSYSMWARDLEPSRIDRVRRKLLDLLAQRTEGQTALIAYAGDAHIVTPLTDDNPTIANLLPALDPGMMPVPGSDASAAVEQALALLESAGIRRGRLLLVTDGVAPNDAADIADLLRGGPTTLGILGIGTSNGAPIALPGGGFLKRGDGSIVIPRLDSSALAALAREGGGRYRSAQIDDSDIAYLLQDTFTTELDETRTLDRSADTWQDMGHWLALPLLPLLLMSFRRGVVLSWLPLACTLVLTLLRAEPARADLWDDLWRTPDQQGARALERGDAAAAQTLFASPQWQGAAAYEAGDMAAAIEGFSAADSADSWYNRGNAFARSGELDQAIAAYQRSLALQPDQIDARENLALVEALKQQQEQEQKEQQQNQQDGQQGEQGEQSESDPAQQNPNQDSAQSSSEGDSGDPQDADPSEPESEQQQARSDPGEANADDEGDPADAADSAEQPAPGIPSQEAMAEALEKDQALEQWLRRVPDDPAGLLREKFRYESRKRERQNGGKDNAQIW